MTPRKDEDQVAERDRAEDGADPQAVEVFRDELVAEADQFLEISGSDPETHGAAPARDQ